MAVTSLFLIIDEKNSQVDYLHPNDNTSKTIQNDRLNCKCCRRASRSHVIHEHKVRLSTTKKYGKTSSNDRQFSIIWTCSTKEHQNPAERTTFRNPCLAIDAFKNWYWQEYTLLQVLSPVDTVERIQQKFCQFFYELNQRIVRWFNPKIFMFVLQTDLKATGMISSRRQPLF